MVLTLAAVFCGCWLLLAMVAYCNHALAEEETNMHSHVWDDELGWSRKIDPDVEWAEESESFRHSPQDASG